MKIKFASFITAIVVCAFTFNAHAATMCGAVSDNGSIKQDGQYYTCLVGSEPGLSQPTRADDIKYKHSLRPNYGLCVTYSSISYASIEPYLENCTIAEEEYACPYNYSYGGGECEKCASGLIAAQEGEYHQNASCDYKISSPSTPTSCPYNKYYTGSSCVQCPSGTAAAPMYQYHKSTSCDYKICPYNQYSNGSRCVNCPNGTFAASEGSYHTNTSCDYCPYDQYSTGSGCEYCPDGTAAAMVGLYHNNTSCDYCPYDQYSTGSGCEYCPDGTFAAQEGEYHTNTECGCPYNQYWTESGCVDCPGGNAAAMEGEVHTSETCNYCYGERYYYDSTDDACYLCPEGGINGQDEPIDSCYVTGGSDATGTFIYTQNCYYSE